MTAYYNEWGAYPAQWLRNLSDGGKIAAGIVDERDIRDVGAEDVRGYSQCHFFAGIGTWSYALRVAGWGDERSVWTGSCPCQPFSVAGKRGGTGDTRHLWPEWFRLIRECKPGVIFGEQVASRDGLAWLDIVSTDLEGAGYTVGAVDICAAGVGAPHIRQRLYFVAHAKSLDRRVSERQEWQESTQSRGGSTASILGHTDAARLEGWSDIVGEHTSECALRQRGTIDDFWRDAEWLPCLDGKARPTQRGLFPLAYGHPQRVARLRAIGNAIVAPLAAAFVRAYMDNLPLIDE